LDGLYCNICNPFEYQANYPSMIPDHMRDVTDLFSDLVNGTLPAVSYVKPDGALDGHPASSKWGLFEAFTKTSSSSRKAILTVGRNRHLRHRGRRRRLLRLRLHPACRFLRHRPAHSIIAVSPFSMGGHISHVYAEHSSFVKFVGTQLDAQHHPQRPQPETICQSAA